MTTKYDAIIFGAGPAGLTAGIYLARARLKPLIVDTGTVGGQMVLSYEVANYPGVESTTGHEISQTMLRQAKSFGGYKSGCPSHTKFSSFHCVYIPHGLAA